MSVKRIGILLRKEFGHGTNSYFFIFAVAAPLIFTVFVNLIFGSFLEGKAKLGIFDHGSSRVVASLREMKSIDLEEFASEEELRGSVERGTRDVGIILQNDFDSKIANGEPTTVTAYIWGESLMKNRAIAASAFMHQIRTISGKEPPIDITPVSLGEKEGVPWKDRFLPMIVLMAIFISGFVVPATSLVDEKEKGTIGAVLTTPATQAEFFIAKGLMGIIVSISMGMLTLILNHAFNTRLGLLMLLLFLGAIMASCGGLMLAAYMKSMASIYSTIKGLGIILYGPGIVAIFPQIPQWVGKLFPTYYVMNPIFEIARKGGSWSTINRDIYVLIGILAVLIALAGVITSKTRQYET
ncbi:MAG: ABC transporter permease [bacterium]|nr:MAG: ABC transporter permease [bacterium]